MSSIEPLKVAFHYEDCRPPRGSPVVDFALRAQQLVGSGPLSASQAAFAQAAGLGAGALHRAGAMPGDAGTPPRAVVERPLRRLRSIETPLGVFEHEYDVQGRLVRTIYPDNEDCRYEYDGCDRLARVCGARHEVRFAYGAFGHLRELTYGTEAIGYDRDSAGRLRRVVFPDGTVLEYRRAGDGSLTEMILPAGRFQYEWQGPQRLARVVLQRRDGTTASLLAGPDVHVADARVDSLPDGGTQVSCALGVWRTLAAGALAEMTGADGEHAAAARSADGRRVTGWSLLGRQTHELSAQGIVQSCCHEDGTRSVFRELPGGTGAVLFGHQGVTLYQYAADGDLQRRRQSTGPCWLLRTSRQGRSISIEHAGGTLRLGFDDRQELRRWHTGDLACRLGQRLAGAQLGGRLLATDAWVAVARFRAIAWEWGAMRPTLRLRSH